MSSYILTCTPAEGHFSPVLAVARHLVDAGHEVRVLASKRYTDRVLGVGAQLLPLPLDADVNLDDPEEPFPGHAALRGANAIRFDILNLFLRPGRAQYEALAAALAAQPADAVITEPMFIGSALLNLLPRAERPPVIALGIFPLGAKSRDTAPFGLGIAPLPGPIGRARNAALTLFAEKGVFAPVTKEADALALEVIGRPFDKFLMDWTSGADALAQFTVPSFEYPRSDLPSSVRFVGPLPPAARDVVLPDWWADLDGPRPVVHVTQGTVANTDTSQLLRPTFEALANEDVLVVATTGGRSTAEFSDLPRNARIANYLPYDALLPKVSVLVTNGGYGGVQQALAHGIPIVVAGQTEDKVEVSARIAWSGVGINLRTNRPRVSRLRAAVRKVLAEVAYHDRAEGIAVDIAAADGFAGIDRILEALRTGNAAAR